MSKKINLIDQERDFGIHELFFSTTDISGKLTSWNKVFSRVSGYDEQELSGKPHSLVRHPDMPRGVFRLFWDMIQCGEQVGAYVKNLAVDGRYYWVYALAVPIDNGYLSVRLKPTSEFFGIVKDVYKELLAYEEEQLLSGMSKVDVSIKSKEVLLSKIKSLGFESYKSFMNKTLLSEIISRENIIKSSTNAHNNSNEDLLSNSKLSQEITNVSQIVNSLFSELSNSTDLSNVITGSFSGTFQHATKIKYNAINATIEASKLGSLGDTLFVLADYLERNCAKTLTELYTAKNTADSSLKSVDEILFTISAAKLQTECLHEFLKENSTQSSFMTVNREKLLLSCFVSRIKKMCADYTGIEQSFTSIFDTLEEIRMLFLSLKVAHVSAKAESSRIDNADRFGAIFDDVNKIIDESKNSIDGTLVNLNSYLSTIKLRYSSVEKLRSSAGSISQSF
jgi:PAS domain S-box-containing protein